ncbi:hypothetical protein F2Q70_00045086 [Brassica cretica]|uniref:Uncharacterized protein n=1 Tax=Brassica cretica TaxID=69181 RepID=A0A8S9KBJ9_BRACR|nr:hypothetical protein F2Q70_00045086 [Brassica cretica]KAF2609112.1 hypothetical protein F2Q68_00046085 [Brassica cretica]
MAGAGGVRVSNRRLFCAQELVHRSRLCFLWLHGEVSSGALVWGFEAIRELKRVGVMALGSVQNRVCVACCFTRSFSGLRWSSMAVGGFLSCYFISRLLITASYQFNLVNGVIRFSEVTNVEVVLRGYWRQPDMVVAVKSTRLMQFSRWDSEASYAKGDSGSPDIRNNEENFTFSGSSLMVENSN